MDSSTESRFLQSFFVHRVATRMSSCCFAHFEISISLIVFSFLYSTGKRYVWIHMVGDWARLDRGRHWTTHCSKRLAEYGGSIKWTAQQSATTHRWLPSSCWSRNRHNDELALSIRYKKGSLRSLLFHLTLRLFLHAALRLVHVLEELTLRIKYQDIALRTEGLLIRT